MTNKINVGIVGATGMVGQRFITLLENHPWFQISALAASTRSAGRKYKEAVEGRWKMNSPIPSFIQNMILLDANHIEQVAEKVDFIFCAVDMKKEEIRALEEAYAKAEVPVVSNNSAHRSSSDVPMIIPEINAGHLKVIAHQKKRLGTKKGFIAVKPNCSIQSYVPALHALKKYEPVELAVCTYQAISGAGKNFSEWPEILDNIIPYIGGEEEKSEQEPLKIWGTLEDGMIKNAVSPKITSQCIRVPVLDGHLAAAFVKFNKTPSEEEMIECWNGYKGLPQQLALPSAPKQFIQYMHEPDRPQTKLDRDYENGMGVTVGRLRKDNLFDYRFVSLSHNTLRGAAGGALLTAELLVSQNYIKGGT